mmetsp:Transcript_22046/g.46502  ORF Transcript_22046/g.46502 Transcript_22046/m.46502 type:complete len:362 (-) Transcript_22046:22-1107(-)
MANASETLGKLAKLWPEMQPWKSGPIYIEVASSLSDGSPKTINVTKTIGHKTICPVVTKRSDSNCHWLPPSWSENNEEFRKETVLPAFTRACSEAGFKISGRWNQDRNCIIFQCFRGILNDERRNREKALRHRSCYNILKFPDAPPKPRNRKSKRPRRIHEDELNDPDFESKGISPCDVITCKFRFMVYWDETRERWFMPHRQKGCPYHQGHLSDKPTDVDEDVTEEEVECDEMDKQTANDEQQDDQSNQGQSEIKTGKSTGVDEQVPEEQIEHNEVNKQPANDEPSDSSPMQHQGTGAYREFHNVYKSVCKLADAAGAEGRKALWEGLYAIGEKQANIIARNNTTAPSALTGATASLPQN